MAPRRVPPLTVNVSCEPSVENACELEGVSGDLVGNPNLGRGGGTLHVPVHLRGAFGDSVALRVSGPNGFTSDARDDHAATRGLNCSP